MVYLKLFDKHLNYEAFKNGDEFVLPNVSHCVQEGDVHYNPLTSYTVRLGITLPLLSNFDEREWINGEWVTTKTYDEYDFPIAVESDDIKSISVNGEQIDGVTYKIDKSNEGTDIVADVILVDDTKIPVGLFINNYWVKTIDFSDSVVEIDGAVGKDEYGTNGAFNSTSLQRVNLNNVKRIGDYAFNMTYAYHLSAVYGLAEYVDGTKSPIAIDLSGVEYIGAYAFKSLVIEGDVTLKEGIDLNPYAFYYTCVHGKVIFPLSYTNINLRTLFYLSYDENTVVNNEQVDDTTFVEGKDVFVFKPTVTGVTFLGKDGSSGFMERGPVLIPSTVTSISDGDTTTNKYPLLGFHEMICDAVNPPTIGASTLINENYYVSGGIAYRSNWTAIYVPNNSVDACKSAQYWSDVASKIKPLSEYQA